MGNGIWLIIEFYLKISRFVLAIDVACPILQCLFYQILKTIYVANFYVGRLKLLADILQRPCKLHFFNGLFKDCDSIFGLIYFLNFPKLSWFSFYITPKLSFFSHLEQVNCAEMIRSFCLVS